jgi:hypothetical protein
MTTRGPRPKGMRRVERWLVGIAMTVVAFILEKAVVRSVRRDGRGAELEAEPTTFSSRGGEVDLDVDLLD